MNAMRQTTCLVVNPATVNNFAALLNCTPAGRASDLSARKTGLSSPPPHLSNLLLTVPRRCFCGGLF